MAGRYKLHSDGTAYFDPNDSGPNQASPEQIAALQGQQASPSAPSPSPSPSPSDQPAPTTGTAPWTGGYTGTGANPTSLVRRWRPAAPTSGVPAMGTAEGFDAAKWADPTQGTSNKYIVGRILQGGGTIEQAAAAVGAKVISPDKIQFPDGFIADVYRDVEGQRVVQYTDVTPRPGGSTALAPTGPAGAASVMGSTLGAQQGASGVQGSSFNDQVRQLLLQQLGGSMGPVTGNDPQIQAEMSAQEAVLERQRRQRRAADAERMAMQGLLSGGQSSGAFDQAVASGFEDKGQALTGIQAQLFTRELQSRRTHVAQLMNMALASGDAEAARNLQYTLALMDDQIRRMTLAQNQSQWNDRFGLDAAQFTYQKDRDLASYGAGY